MSDSISRQDAIDALGEEPDIWNDTDEEWAYRNAWVEHISAIKSLPSVDAVEVVRCKDCKYLGIKDLVYGYCKYRMTGIVMPDDYCSHGERKEP